MVRGMGQHVKDRLSEDFMKLTLNKDGTVTMTTAMGEDSEIETGTWIKIDNKTVEITFDGEAQTCSCDGKKLTIEADGAKVVLKK